MFYRRLSYIFPSLLITSCAYAGTMGPVEEEGGHLFGSVDFQVVQPYFQNNPEFYFLDAKRIAYTDAFFYVDDRQHQRDVSHHMDLAPEFTLGYILNNGLGFRTRFWFYYEDTKHSITTAATSVTDLTFSFPASSAAPIGLDIDTRDNNLPNGMTVKTDLKTYVWDALISQDYKLSRSTIVLAGGARYAYMSQAYNAYETQQPGPTLDIRFDPPVPQFITDHDKTFSKWLLCRISKCSM